LASSFADGLAERDRRALRWGAWASLAVIVVALGLPTARRFNDREALISTRRAELARWRGIAAAESSLAAAVDARTMRMTSFTQRPLGAPSEALVSAALQSRLQRYADESQLTVSELNVAGQQDTLATTLPVLPATLVALGDIHGVADLLTRLQRGDALLEVRELTLQVNPARAAIGGGELVQVTVQVHAPYVLE
jgi:hypothetical protein